MVQSGEEGGEGVQQRRSRTEQLQKFREEGGDKAVENFEDEQEDFIVNLALNREPVKLNEGGGDVVSEWGSGIVVVNP